MGEKEKVKIIVATHKKYRMPDDPMYLPIQVGAAVNTFDLGYQRDDSGDNISVKNPSFCELTGLYWAWKNVDADYIGLVHYRRYFTYKKSKDVWKRILTYEELNSYTKDKDIFVPQKRRYYIETLYSHYAHTHYGEHLDMTRNIIQMKYPQYLKSFDRVMKQTYGYMFNMFIMKREMMDSYCAWLFDILFELERKIEIDTLSAFQQRCFGRISEIIFNVWLDYQLDSKKLRQDRIKEFDWEYMEPIKFLEKTKAFLAAKFMGKRYNDSF